MAIQKGTGFTNLNKILRANTGNKLGQTVSSGIQEQTQGVKTQVKSAQEQFQEEAQKGRLDTGEAAAKRQEILGRFAPSSGASNVPAPTTNTAQQLVQAPVTDEEIKGFTKYRTGTYTGPKELQDQQTLYGQAQQTQQLGGLARSEGGRQELLRRFVGGADYTQGQRQLDSSILGQQPGQLGSVARQTRGAVRDVEKAASQASGLAQEYMNRAKGFGEETRKMIGETKLPLSEDLVKRVQDAQKLEEDRLSQYKQLQDILVGDVADYKPLNSWTRAGLALQEAANKKILSDSDLAMLLGGQGKVGLLQRGANLGLDMNRLLADRLTNQIAQNISRTGIASPEDIAKLNALDKLAGKTGTDLEFLEGQEKYKAGKTGLDIAALEKYLAEEEAARAGSDQSFADQLAASKPSYMDLTMLGAGQALGGVNQALGGALSQVTNPMAILDPSQTLSNAENIIGGAGNAAIGGQQFMYQAPNAVLQNLMNLKVGGQSLSSLPGGNELAKAIELNSQLGQMGTGLATQGLSSIAGAISPVSNVAKSIANSVSNAVKSVTGGGIKISDEDLKTNVEYSPKDIQNFMDRIKPAAYDYKEEVKNSPLASKNRELGVMAQDLEKSKLGKEAVKDTSMGKVVDYDNLEPKMMASIAALNKRLKELENKK